MSPLVGGGSGPSATVRVSVVGIRKLWLVEATFVGFPEITTLTVGLVSKGTHTPTFLVCVFCTCPEVGPECVCGSSDVECVVLCVLSGRAL